MRLLKIARELPTHIGAGPYSGQLLYKGIAPDGIRPHGGHAIKIVNPEHHKERSLYYKAKAKITKSKNSKAHYRDRAKAHLAASKIKS